MGERPRFLVTAGNTREMIDRVRDWGNVFTGNTGFAIARALEKAGAEVDLLTSNTYHLSEVELRHRAGGLSAMRFATHAELRDELRTRMTGKPYDGVFMTAAVADYQPGGVFQVIDRRQGDGGTEVWTVRDVWADKVKSAYREIAVVGRPTEKLVDRFRTEWHHRGLLVKFKLEVGVSADELIRIGQASRTSSGADYLVANTLDMVEGKSAGAYLLSDQGHEWVPRAELAERLARLAEQWVRVHPGPANVPPRRA